MPALKKSKSRLDPDPATTSGAPSRLKSAIAACDQRLGDLAATGS
jgi:hypothetical protein